MPEGEKVTRAERLKSAGLPDGLPRPSFEVRVLADLIEGFGGVGWFKTSGMGGIEPVPYGEITAYATACGDLDMKDIRAIRIASESYVAGYRRGLDPLAFAPVYASEADDPGLVQKREAVAEGMRGAFRSMARQRARQSS